MLLFACKKQLEAPGMDSEMLVPLLHTRLGIEQLVPDSLRSTDENGMVSLIFRNTLYEASLGSFQELNTREYNETAQLQKLKLSPRTVVQNISLGQVAANMGALGTYIISQNGNSLPFPAISGLSYGPLVVDGSSFFETVTLDSGYMDVTIQNGFPTALANIQFEIRNASNNAFVGSQTFANVPAGATQTKTINLAGKTVEGNLEGNILNFDVVGTGATSVLIDTTDKLKVTMVVRDMNVVQATAVFPAQDVISLKDTNHMNNVQDLRITKATAAKGFVKLKVTSTVEDTLFFDYLIPGGKKDGVAFEVHEKINPAPAGGSSTVKEFNYAVDGYTFDLTGAPLYDEYNTFYSELTARIDSTGKVVNISLNDSINVVVQLFGFIPEYVEGYLGYNQSNIGPATAPIKLFKNISSGSIDFDQVNVSVGVSNGNGVPFNVELQQLVAENSRSGKSVAIDLNSIPNPLEIEAAASKVKPWENTWAIDANSDNINAALNIFPNQLRYQLKVSSNPSQNINSLNQFAIDSNKLSAYADIEVPLSFVADKLTLMDTVEFDGAAIKNPEDIGSGTLYVIAMNSFPVNASLEMHFYDEGDLSLTSIRFEKQLASGSAANANQTVLSWEFDRSDLDQILACKKIIMSAEINTEDGSNPIKIYSTQDLQIQLSARFNYNLDF